MPAVAISRLRASEAASRATCSTMPSGCSRADRPPRRDDIRYHMTMVAMNETGYRNLMQLASSAFLDGYYYKPRMDLELLAEHSEGLIATSGCLGGHVPQLLAPDASQEEGNIGQVRDYEAAVAAAATYQDIFGKGNFFIEVQDHGIPAQQRIMSDLVRISADVGAPLLAANDKARAYVTSYVAISSAGGFVTRLFDQRLEIMHAIQAADPVRGREMQNQIFGFENTQKLFRGQLEQLGPRLVQAGERREGAAGADLDERAALLMTTSFERS